MQQRIRSHRTFLLAVGLAALVVVPAWVLYAQTRSSDLQVYRVNRQSQWQQWTFPAGTLEFSRTGSVTPVKFKGIHNATLNAGEFTHALVSGKEIQGGAWKAGSNPATADNVMDGDPNTFWQPDPDAPLEDWWIEIDLGRATLVTEIRLVFPDQEGARPFREFRVFGTEGRRVTRKDIFSFHLIGGTTKPIDETLVTYDIESLVRDVRLVRQDGAGAPDDAETDETYDLLQYIRILVDAKTPEAALAEVEVYTPGENIALQTLERGGTIQERSGRGFAYKMADGDANTDWGARQERLQDPIAWDWDLGALFWVDRIVMRTSDFLIRTATYSSAIPQIRTHALSVSDGSRTLTGAVDYEELFIYDKDALLASSSEFPGQLTYQFTPRPVRFVAAKWAGTAAQGYAQVGASMSGFLVETLIFPVGHVAQVGLESDFIDLGQIAGDNRAKVIKSLNWEADLPPGARIQARTRSGNALQENFRYFRKDGTEITLEQYDQMAKVLRGETLSSIGIGEDWSEWSNFYQRSGEQFLSPSPRRFAQVQLVLSSDRPSTAPTVRALELEFTDAFLAGAEGEVLPRTAEPGVAQIFSYRIMPVLGSGDPGFNRILLQTPSPTGDLALKIGDAEAEPAAVRTAGDSLVVELPRTVRREEVELAFSSVLKNNASLFKAFVGQTGQPEIWQPVDPVRRSATTVYLPSVSGTDQLIANLSVQPFISPNGDGVGDSAEIRFHVLKVDAPAQVRIYTLDGRLVHALQGQFQPDQSYLYTWSGQDRDARLVPPGSYLCRISVDAQAGAENLLRVISVVY